MIKTDQNAGHGVVFYFFLDWCEGGINKQCLTICLQIWFRDFNSLRTDDLQWTVFFSFLNISLKFLDLNVLYITMPMKRSSESSGRDGVFLIHSLTKTLCSSPEEIHTDFNGQTHFHQEDDSGVKSGNGATTHSKCGIINFGILLFCNNKIPSIFSHLSSPIFYKILHLKPLSLYIFLWKGFRYGQVKCDTDWPHGGATTTD